MIWLKFIGIFIILLSGTGIGWSVAHRYIFRVHYLWEFYQAISLINTEMVYNQSRLLLALQRTVSQIEKPVSVLFQQTADILKKDKEKTFSIIWSELIAESNLEESDKKIIISWGNRVGSTQLSEQEKNNKMTLEKLKETRNKAEKIAENKVKLARYAGVLVSFLLIILFY